MNRKLASILAIALCLSSCGSTGTDTPSQAETTTTTTTAETTTTTTAATTTAETTTTTSATTTETTTTAETITTTITTTTAPETTTTIETTAETSDILLYDANGVKLTFLGAEETRRGIKFNVLIENDSGIDYMFQTRDAYINGMGTHLTFSPKVISGKKDKDYMMLRSSEMEENGFTMENIETLEFKLHVFQYDDWDNSFDSEPIIIQF